MKKIIVMLVVITLLFIGYAHDQFVWCKKLIFGEPTTHVIQKGEYLSTIAKKYYGNSNYWRELALINRAPNSNRIYPGEEIIIPSLNAIKEIRRTTWLSKVNEYVKNEEDIIARLNRGEEVNLAANEPRTIPERILDSKISASLSVPESAKTATALSQPASKPAPAVAQARAVSSTTLALGAVAIMLLAAVVAFALIRQRKRSQQITIVDDDELNLIGDDGDTEPDYQNYLRQKSLRKKGVLVG